MLIVEKKPKSIEAEAYRTLRTNIQYSSYDKEIKSILVTSADAKEGKTIISSNLALAFAQNGQSTILVDCDLRKPSIHKAFDISNLAGLSEVLIKKEKLENVLNEYCEKLSILPSGKIPPNPSEMLGSNTMRTLLEYLKSKYEVVILDTPPIGLVTDAQVLSTIVDGAIIVVRLGFSKTESVIEAKNLMMKVGANILGTVLNGAEKVRKSYYYG